jgi:CHAD domain-containing protein
MSIARLLLEYYQELDRGFHLYWIEVLRDYGPETVHGLRVNLKKQRAFFYLLEALTPSFAAVEASEVFEGVYRKAGKVRDLQVERALIEKNERKLQLEHQLSVWLEKQEVRRVLKLQQYEKGHTVLPFRKLSERVGRIIGQLPEKGLEVQLGAYYIKIIRGVIAFVRGDKAAGDDLHDLRRFIKELFYNLNFLQRYTGPKALQCGALVRLDELQHALGKWHDFDFAISHLEKKKKVVDAGFLSRLEAERQASEAEARALFDGLEAALTELEQRIKSHL